MIKEETFWVKNVHLPACFSSFITSFQYIFSGLNYWELLIILSIFLSSESGFIYAFSFFTYSLFHFLLLMIFKWLQLIVYGYQLFKFHYIFTYWSLRNYYKTSLPNGIRILGKDYLFYLGRQCIILYLYKSPTSESVFKVWKNFLCTSYFCKI